MAQEFGDKVAEMNAHRILGDAHLKKEEYDDSISYSRRYLTMTQEFGDKVAEMNAYWILGYAHWKKEEYDDVLAYSRKYFTIAQESGDKVAEMKAYNMLGDAHVKKEEYDDAILCRKKYLTLAQETFHKMAEMNAYKMLGGAHLKKEEYDDAISYSRKCLAIGQESGDKAAEMNAYVILGAAHFEKEEYDDAISYSKKYLAIAQESGYKEAEKNAYMMLGDVHLKKEEYDDAILYCKKCLSIAQESGDKVAEMAAYMLLAVAHLNTKEYDDVMLYSRKCLAIAQESVDKVAETKAHMILGCVHIEKEEYDDAISCSKKCLSIAQESGDKVAEMGAYEMLADAFLKKEEYDDAISYSRKYLTIAQESGDKVAERNAYVMLGCVHQNKERIDDAYSCFSFGKAIAEEVGDKFCLNSFINCLYFIHLYVGTAEEDDGFEFIKNMQQVVDSLSQPGQQWWDCYLRFINHEAEHEYEQGISCLQEAEAMAAQLDQHDLVERFGGFGLSWMCKQELSNIYVLLEQYDKAMQYQQEALDIALKGQGHKSSLLALSHAGLGKVHCQLEDFDSAEKSFKDALKCFELIFDNLKQNDQFKIAFLDQYRETYKMLLKILMETSKKEEALVLSDHYRAKALKDLLVSSYGFKKDLNAHADLQYADVQSLASRSNYTLLFYSMCFEKLYTFLVEAGNELVFSVEHFQWCDVCLDKLVDKTFDEMKVRQVVNCEDRSSGVMEDEKNKNEEKDELTQLLTRQIEKRLSEQCRSICGCRGNPSENSDESSLISGLEILYHKLIHDIKCLMKQDEIVIIPEGPLYKVPFAALRDPDTGRYLSETKLIRMAPSMASLKLLQECPEEHHSRKHALIIGAAVIGEVMLDGVQTEIPPLFGALEEAKDIGFILGVEPLLGANATKPVVLEKLKKGASVVHIAAHGIQSKATIVLAPSPEIREKRIPDEEDYMLTMADVQQAQVRAQLVVLSCCHSGRGEIKTEGVVGMCRAFLASGARAVVGSLWAVDDDATRKFMATFYEYLKDGKSASTSLHLTLNDMRSMPKYREPNYWAPFFLMGDDVTIQFED